MATAFPFPWQLKIKKLGFNFIENSIVKNKGLYILPFDKKTLLKNTGDLEDCLPLHPLSPPHTRILIELLYTFLFKMLLALASRSTWNMLFGNVCFFNKIMKSW